MNSKVRSVLSKTIIRILLVLLCLCIVVPFFFMFLNSFKTPAEYYSSIWAMPSHFDFSNYKLALDYTNLLSYAANTVFVVIIGLALNLSLSAMVSYAITRIDFKYSKAIYRYFLIGLLVPQVLALIPMFFVSRFVLLYNTRTILILAYAIFNLPFAVFTLTAFFKTLPKALEEAAMIDGASYFTTFFKVMLPLAKPGLITVGVFNFLEMWNEYMLALTLIADENKKTISLAVLKIQAAQGVKAEWGAMFACCVMVILPVIVIYAIFQKKLTGGLTAGSVKG